MSLPPYQRVAPDGGPGLRLFWSERDQLRMITLVGLAGLALAGAMAAFGLPAVDLHGPLHRYGIMDPLCGGTRAARLTAQGHLADAWRYNPLGILAVTAAGTVAIRATIGLLTGRWLTVDTRWTRGHRRAALLVLLVLTVALEIRQQGRSGLLLMPY